MSVEHPKQEPIYSEEDVETAANRLGMPTEYLKAEGTRNFVECLVAIEKIQSKLTRHTDPDTLELDLQGRKDLADLMLRATSWIMETGVEGNEDNWDTTTYVIQKLTPVLNAYGFKIVQEIKPDNGEEPDEPKTYGDLPKGPID